MAKFKITWNESGISEEVESDIVDAQEYKTSRFGTPASEVTVEEVAVKKAKAAPVIIEPVAVVEPVVEVVAEPVVGPIA